MEEDRFWICHPLLDEYCRNSPNVVRNDEIAARDTQIVRSTPTCIVYRKVVQLEIREASITEFASEDRKLEETKILEAVKGTLSIVRGEAHVKLRKMLGDLVHLPGLIDRSADEEDAL